MDRFISSIRKSIEDENWFSALFLTLALTDICGALEKPPTGKLGAGQPHECSLFEQYV
jgi:hypothetical protein